MQCASSSSRSLPFGFDDNFNLSDILNIVPETLSCLKRFSAVMDGERPACSTDLLRFQDLSAFKHDSSHMSTLASGGREEEPSTWTGSRG